MLSSLSFLREEENIRNYFIRKKEREKT